MKELVILKRVDRKKISVRLGKLVLHVHKLSTTCLLSNQPLNNQI